MLAVSVALFCLVGLALVGMGFKYITAVPPMQYHAEILSNSTVPEEALLIFGALYKAVGGAFAALGTGILIISIFGVWQDIYWAKLALLVMIGILGYFSTTAPRAVETHSGVRTPWRIAAGLSSLGLLAFVLSLI